MKKVMFLILLFTASFNLEAAKSLCVGNDCQTEDPDFIDISDFSKREVFEALHERACKYETKKNFFGNKINYKLDESDFNAIENMWGWKVEKWKGCKMWVDLSQNLVNFRIFNDLHGKGAAQKAIKKLRKQKVLLS